MNISLDNQDQWAEIFEQSDYTPEGASAQFGIPWATIKSWLYCKTDQQRGPLPLVTPSKKYRERAIEMMKNMNQTKRMEKHPSYGYATPEQIKQLETLGIGPQRDHILAQIEKQNKQQGKRR